MKKKITASDDVIAEAASCGDWALIRICELISRATQSDPTEFQTVLVSVALALIRRRRLLDFAGELLGECSKAGPSFLVLSGQADLMEMSGNLLRAKALRLLAATAPGAPDLADEVISVWAMNESEWRKHNTFKKGKLLRRAVYHRAMELTVRKSR
jgi:hypothetical protein